MKRIFSVLFVLFVFCASFTRLSAQVTFGAPTGYPTGSSFNVPFFGALGDYNGDGKLDVVVSDGSQPTVLRLLLGNGAGGFGGPINIFPSGPCPTPTTPGCVTNTGRVLAADVNADGKLDIVTANNHSRNFSVILGNGDGTFGAVNNYGLGGEGRAVAVGDLNNDGRLDLIGGESNFAVYVFLGNGDGTFGPGASYVDGGNNRQDIVVADLNGDGNKDVVVSNRDTGDISVFLGNGLGTLTPLARFPGAHSTLVVADFNGDGKPDVAAGQTPTLNSVAVFLGTGGGSLGPATYFNTGGSGSYTGLTAADFDGDGKVDLAVSNVSSHNVSVLPGDGAGSFGPPTTHPNPIVTGILNGPAQVMAGDLNADGKIDIAVVSSNNDNVVVMLNTTQILACPSNLSINGGVPNFCQGITQPINLTLSGSNLTNATITWSLNGPTSNPNLGSGTTLTTTLSGLQPGNYSITATATKQGCPNASAVINFPVFANPSVTISGSTQVCQFDAATLTANVAGGLLPLTFSWSNGATTQSISPSTSSTGSFTFSVTVTDGHGCTATASTTLTVNPRPSFSQSIPTPLNAHLCSPLLMDNEDFNVAANNVQNWFIQANSSGSLKINVIATAVNPIEESGTVTFTLYDPSNSVAGTTTLTYPTGSVAPGSESSSNILITPSSSGGIYRMQVVLGDPTVSGTRPAHHYRFEIEGAVQAAVCSPSINNFEGQPVRWGLNVNPGEGLTVQVVLGNVVTSPTIQTQLKLLDPNGAVYFADTSPQTTPRTINVPSPATGQWTLEVTSSTDHYKLDKQSGSDRGIYLTRRSDLTPPHVVTKNITVSLNSSGSVIVQASDIDNGSSDNCHLKTLLIDGAASKSFACNNVGPNPVTLTAIDDAGNSNSAPSIVTVADNKPPTISCPLNISVVEELGKGSAKVAYAAPSTADNCAVASTVCNPPSGSTFPVGTTNVTCTVTDASGNQSSCSFTVTVRKIVCYTVVSVDANFTGKGWKGAKQVPVQNAKVIMLPKGPVQANVQNLLDATSVWANLTTINGIGDPVLMTGADGKVIAVSTVADPNGWAIYLDLKNAVGVGVPAPPITAGNTEIAVANTDCAPQKNFTVKLESDGMTTTATFNRQGNISGSLASGSEQAEVTIEAQIPTEYALLDAYPNPFNPTTTIRFNLPEAGHVTLKVYDLLGRDVATLVQEDRSAGRHVVHFDATELPSSVYLYRITAGTFTQIKRMVLMK